MRAGADRQNGFKLVTIQIVGLAQTFLSRLSSDPDLIHSITPEQFEDFVCDRLYAMGMEPKKVGLTNRKDGGVDIVFWPRNVGSFPFLGAAQLKHHKNPETRQGPGSIRDFAGVLAGHPFNVGMFVTNTSFSPDARWFAKEHSQLMRLRDFNDIRRWMFNNFEDNLEWREIPKAIELCPGVEIDLRNPNLS